jgi:hypothetical protein
MTPTLLGRIQTRIAVLVVVGGLWTAIVTLVLPGLPATMSLGERYAVTYRVLAIVLLLGVVWEFVYHGLQQFRWEKDWPTLFGLLTGINEGLAAWLVGSARLESLPLQAFLVHFVTTWVITWAWINGPMQIFFIRWRFRGGRFL